MQAAPRSRPRWSRRAVIAIVAAVALLVPSGAALGENAAPEDDLDTARERLQGASRQLADIEVELRRVNDEVAALDARLMTATTELSRVTSELADAEVSLAEANTEERVAAEQLSRAQQDLSIRLDEWDTHRRRLADRLVHAYKHGGATTQQLAVRGMIGASDWHEVAMTLETVDRLTADEDSLVENALGSTRASASLRAEAGNARRFALEAARAASEQRQRVARLVSEQQRIVTEVETDRERKSHLLSSLEADASARAVLVRDLERRVAELEFAATSVFVPIDVDLDVHGPPPAWAARLPREGHAYAAATEAIAARHGLDGRLLAALVWTESAFRPDAVSHAGAMGLAQLMPGTARGLRVDPRDPLQNLDGGARYLRLQLDRFGRIDLALAAYNAGPGRVERAGGIPDIVETQLYVVRVLERFERLRA